MPMSSVWLGTTSVANLRLGTGYVCQSSQLPDVCGLPSYVNITCTTVAILLLLTVYEWASSGHKVQLAGPLFLSYDARYPLLSTHILHLSEEGGVRILFYTPHCCLDHQLITMLLSIVLWYHRKWDCVILGSFDSAMVVLVVFLDIHSLLCSVVCWMMWWSSILDLSVSGTFPGSPIPNSEWLLHFVGTLYVLFYQRVGCPGLSMTWLYIMNILVPIGSNVPCGLMQGCLPH